MELTSQRLRLREFRLADFEAILAYDSDPEVVKYVCYGPYTPDECRKELTWHIAHQQAEQRIFYHLGVTLADDDRLIGWCGLEMISHTNREAEIAYALHRDYWGQGFATEAAAAMLSAGFDQLGLHRIFATCNPLNEASIHVLTKLGMRYEGCMVGQKWCRDAWRDVAMYAILEDEWRDEP